MKNTKIFTKAILFSLTVFLFSCGNILNDTISLKTGTLSVGVNAGAERTVFSDAPDFDKMTYALYCIDSSEKVTSYKYDSYTDLQVASIELAEGDWDLRLAAKVGDEKYFSMTVARVLIESGKKTSVSFDFSTAIAVSAIDEKTGLPLEGKEIKTGDANVTFYFPSFEKVAFVKAALCDIKTDAEVEGFGFESLEIKVGEKKNEENKAEAAADANAEESDKKSERKYVVYLKTGIPSGTYFLKFKMYEAYIVDRNRAGAEIKPGYTEVIRINAGRVSTAICELSEINKQYSITYNFYSEEYPAKWVTGENIKFGFNENEKVTLPTEKDIECKGCTFGGWYLDKDCTGNAVTGWQDGEKTSDVVLYAKWTKVETWTETSGGVSPDYDNFDSTIFGFDGAVTSGELYYGYAFGLTAKNESTKEKVSATFGTEFGKKNEFSIKLEKAKYKLSLFIIDSNKKEYSLNVSKIVLGDKTSSGAMIDLTDSEIDLASTKLAVYFAPSTDVGNEPSSEDQTIMATKGQGGVNLAIKSNCIKNSPASVEYYYEREHDGVDTSESGASTSGLGSVNFAGGIATVKSLFPFANGVYRFEFKILDKDNNTLATTGNFVNVFTGFVTDTWRANENEFFVTENGVTSFVVTDELIGADEPEPNTVFTMEEFKKYCKENGITTESENFTVLKIPTGYTEIALCDYESDMTNKPSVLSYYQHLKGVIIPESVTIIHDSSFFMCGNLEKINVPDSVTKIEGYAFFGCSNLREINLPPKLKTLEEGLFNQCKSLTSITLPETITEIGNGALQGCETLTEVVVPENVTKIGCAAFWCCNGLSKIIMKPANPPTLVPFPSDGVYPNSETTNGIFEWCHPDLKIFVPESSVQAYKRAWTEYADRITYVGEIDPTEGIVSGIKIEYSEENDIEFTSNIKENEKKNSVYNVCWICKLHVVCG